MKFFNLKKYIKGFILARQIAKFERWQKRYKRDIGKIKGGQ